MALQDDEVRFIPLGIRLDAHTITKHTIIIYSVIANLNELSAKVASHKCS